jgi:hypothetical protein
LLPLCFPIALSNSRSAIFPEFPSNILAIHFAGIGNYVIKFCSDKRFGLANVFYMELDTNTTISRGASFYGLITNNSTNYVKFF